MNTKRNLHSSVPDIMLDSADDIEISVAPDTLDALFSERGSTHFPEARNRRRDDQQDYVSSQSWTNLEIISVAKKGSWRMLWMNGIRMNPPVNLSYFLIIFTRPSRKDKNNKNKNANN